MKKLSIISFFIVAFSLTLCAGLQAQEQSKIQDITVRVEPADAGKLNYQIIEDSIPSEIINHQVEDSKKLSFSVDFFAGWQPVDTQTKYNEDGIPVELVFYAEPMPKSTLSDSVVISEVFFCGYLNDSLFNWFEITNKTDNMQVLDSCFIQTSEGKYFLETKIEIPAESCVVISDPDGIAFKNDIDSLVLADFDGAIVSTVVWDNSIMNLPQDTAFSLEIIDVFKSSSLTENWEIIYGNGRPLKLPEMYAVTIVSGSVWVWLKLVVWGVAGILLLLLLIMVFRKNTKR
jgi:hypothetical protein